MQVEDTDPRVSSQDDDPILAPKPGEIIDIGFLRETVDDAQNAITGLWQPQGKTFWRSTVQRDREATAGNAGKFYPTVSLRCVDSLLLLAGEGSGWVTQETARGIHESYVPAVVARTIEDLRQSTLNQVGEEANVFTLSIYAQTFARILSYEQLDETVLKQAAKNLTVGIAALLSHPALDGGHIGTLHPFLVYRVKRALNDAVKHSEPGTITKLKSLAVKLERHARESILINLAKHAIGALNP